MTWHGIPNAEDAKAADTNDRLVQVTLSGHTPGLAAATLNDPAAVNGRRDGHHRGRRARGQTIDLTGAQTDGSMGLWLTEKF